MGQENIKTLLQCEKTALQIIANARKERDELKKKARTDAMEIVDELKREKERESDEFKKEGIIKIAEVENECKRKNEGDLQRLENVSVDDLVDVIVEKIYNVSK